MGKLTLNVGHKFFTSNKTTNEKSKYDWLEHIDTKLISYTYPRPDYDVAVLNPCLDYISLTLPITDKEHQASISSCIKHLVDDQELIFPVGALSNIQKDNINHPNTVKKPSPSELTRYKQNFYIFPLEDKSKAVLLQIGPKAGNHYNYMRLRFNPEALGRTGVRNLNKLLNEDILNALYDWETFVRTARVTRFDIAVDIVGSRVMELLPLTTKKIKNKKNMYYTSPSGRPQTKYIDGTKSSSANTYLYNKRREAIDTKKAPIFNKDLIHTRLEIRHKVSNPGQGLKKIVEANNPLKKIRLLDCFKCNSNGKSKTVNNIMPPYEWIWFFDSCSYRGIEEALEVVLEEDRAKIRKALITAEKGVWNPELLWGTWENTVLNSGLFDDPFDSQL